MASAFSTRIRAQAVVVVAVFLICPSSAPAQEIGVKAGVNSASLTPEEDEDPDLSRHIGPIGGGWVRTPSTGRFSFQVEGLYSEKGVKFEAAGFRSEVRLGYVEIPLLARADFGASGSTTRAFVVGGAAPAFNVLARGKVAGNGQEQTRNIDDAINTPDFGLVGGAGLVFGRALFEARYTHGLLHINTDDNGDEDRIKNRVFSVMFGFRLR